MVAGEAVGAGTVAPVTATSVDMAAAPSGTMAVPINSGAASGTSPLSGAHFPAKDLPAPPAPLGLCPPAPPAPPGLALGAVTMAVAISAALVGKVIGKRGETIRRLQEETGTSVLVSGPSRILRERLCPHTCPFAYSSQRWSSAPNNPPSYQVDREGPEPRHVTISGQSAAVQQCAAMLGDLLAQATATRLPSPADPSSVSERFRCPVELVGKIIGADVC